MYEVNVLSMDERKDGNLVLLGDGLKLPADAETVSNVMNAAGVTYGDLPLAAFDYEFRMEAMNNILIGSQPLDELNFLAQRLSDLSEYERRMFEGAVQLDGSKTAADCINLTYNLDEYNIYPNVANAEQLGQYFSTRIPQLKKVPPEFMQFLDFEQLGQLMFAEDNAVFANGHYVMDMGGRHTEIYKGSLPEYSDTCYMKVRLTSAAEPDGTWLKFPVDSENGQPDEFEKSKELQAALEKLHVGNLSECTVGIVTDCVCIAPVLEKCIGTHKDLPLVEFIWKANNVGYAIEELRGSHPELPEKFYAALTFEHCTDLDFAADISQNLRCYDFVPQEYYSAETYGELMLRKNCNLTDEPLLCCFDMDALGKEAMSRAAADKTQFGVISRSETPFLYDYFTPPSQGIQMT
jgi:hypothetical protein